MKTNIKEYKKPEKTAATFSISKDLLTRFKKVCKRYEFQQSHVVETLIREFLKKD